MAIRQEMSKKYVIFDIDYTVADATHREWLFGAGRDDEAHDLAHLDLPIHPTIFICQSFLSYLQYRVLFVTGRHEDLRETTLHWLQRIVSPSVADSQLIMRPNDSWDSNAEYKGKVIDKLKETGIPIFVFFEDDAEVIEVLRGKGVPCLQAHLV